MGRASVIEPRLGDLFVVKERLVPWRVQGPFPVTRIGRKFFYVSFGRLGDLKIRLEDGRIMTRGLMLERYDDEVHGATLEASLLAAWWLSLEADMPSINKLRAMKAAYDNVVEFEGPDPRDDDE